MFSIIPESFEAAWASQQRRGSQDSDERSWTRWRRIGESRGKRAGGGRLEAKAVGRQARRGGRRSLGAGGGMYMTIVKVLVWWMREGGGEIGGSFKLRVTAAVRVKLSSRQGSVFAIAVGTRPLID